MIDGLFREEYLIDLTTYPCQSPNYMQTNHAPDYSKEWQNIYITKEPDQEIGKIILVEEFIINDRCQ